MSFAKALNICQTKALDKMNLNVLITFVILIEIFFQKLEVKDLNLCKMHCYG